MGARDQFGQTLMQGIASLTAPRDLAKVRSDIEAAGYRGVKIVLIVPASLWRVKLLSEVTADMLRKVGMNVEEQVMDPASWGRRAFLFSTPMAAVRHILATGSLGHPGAPRMN